MPRRLQRTRPSQPSSAFIPPQALAVYESAILFSSLRMRGGHCLIITKALTPSPFSFSSSFCSLGRNNFGPEAGKAIAAALAKNTTITTIKCVHPSASTCRLWKRNSLLFALDAGWTLFIARVLTPSTLFLSSFPLCSLEYTDLGPEAGNAIAAALAKNTTITTIKCVHPSASTCRL